MILQSSAVESRSHSHGNNRPHNLSANITRTCKKPLPIWAQGPKAAPEESEFLISESTKRLLPILGSM